MTKGLKIVTIAAIFCCLIAADFAHVNEPNETHRPQKTEVVIIGTIHDFHYKNAKYSPDVLKEIILALKPDAILNELPLSLVEPNGRPLEQIRGKWVGPESWAADTVAQQLGIRQIPFDRPDREENFKKTKYFEREKQSHEQFKNWFEKLYKTEPNCVDLKTAKLYDHALSAQMDLLDEGPEAINSEAFDSIIRIKHSVAKEIIPEILKKYPEYNILVEDMCFFKDEWQERNRIMVDNIIKAVKEYPGKRLVVLTGGEHRYVLKDLLKAEPGIELKEFWEIVERQPDGSYKAIEKPVVHSIADGAIEIKPRLKYELIISIHVLKTAEDHHKLFVPWAKKMRKALSPTTLREAMTLIENAHEWQLCSLAQDYDGPDTIEGLTKFIAEDQSGQIVKWASQSGCKPLMEKLGISAEHFPAWYADFLTRYYREGFEKQWLSEHKKLVYADAKTAANELANLGFSPITFMEDTTGRKFTGGTKIILYPSSFSRPQHAYGFSEKGSKVSIYKIGKSKNRALSDAFHELSHPLIRDWWKAERLQNPIAKIAKDPLLKAGWEQIGKGSYEYPIGWLEELIVHSMGYYMEYKAGFITKKQARLNTYCSFEDTLYDILFDRYDSFATIDDFIFYALTHIEVIGEGKDAKFVVIREENPKNKVNQIGTKGEKK